jgi:hypothetical protein
MSAPTKVQLVGGHFQDTMGNILAEGSLVMELVQDEQLSNSTGQVCGGIKITVPLDEEGNVFGTSGDESEPNQYVWPTDVMTPSGASYTVWGYAADGQLAWGPNYNLLVPSGATFDVDNWIPNSTGNNGAGNTGGITLQTNGTNNGSQQLLDLQQGANITLTDNGSGQITISSAGSSGPRNRSWHGWTTDGSDAVISPVDGFGCTPSGSSSSGLGVAPTAALPAMVNINTGAASSVQYVAANGSPHTVGKTVTLGILGLVELKAQQPATTTKRVWIGLLGGMPNNATFYASDTPVEPTCAFRYSTHASDTAWECVVTDGTTQLTVSSSVAIDTALHTFAIQFTTPNVLFFIDGVLVATVAITTTTLTTATGFCPCMTVDNVGSSNNVSSNLSYIYWDTNV